MGLKSFLPNLRNACPAIRPQYKPDNPGNKIMKLSTVFRVGKFGAIAAGSISCFKAAGADLAPGSLFIVVATGASVFQISSASAAIKSTESNQFRIRHYCLHYFSFCKHTLCQKLLCLLTRKTIPFAIPALFSSFPRKRESRNYELSPSYRSVQNGFAVSISSNFHLRFHFFICFSLPIADSAVSCSSYQTS